MTIMRSARSFGYLCRPMRGEYINFIIVNGYYPQFKKFCFGFEYKATTIAKKVPSQNRLAYLFLVHKNLIDQFYLCRDFDCDLKELYRIAQTEWLFV